MPDAQTEQVNTPDLDQPFATVMLMEKTIGASISLEPETDWESADGLPPEMHDLRGRGIAD